MYAFLILLGLLGVIAYVLVIFREVPGAVDERLGTLEPLPKNLGQWQVDEASEQGKAALTEGLQREVRIWHEAAGGFFGREKLVEQARYRNLTTREIERVDEERPIKRRRIHKA
jgi:hypothetical protein